MAAPTAPQLFGLIIQNYHGPRGPEADEYLDLLSKSLSAGWGTWQTSMTFGGLAVTGAGIGAWSGVGLGGVMKASPYSPPPVNFKANTAEQKKLTESLFTVLKTQFETWVSSYKFTSLPFVGTNTGTIVTPGTFTAFNTPTPLSGAGAGTNPVQIKASWEPNLTPPLFNLSAPECRLGILTTAVSTAIETAFTTIWLATSNASSNFATGATSPPAGAGGGTSVPNGKIV